MSGYFSMLFFFLWQFALVSPDPIEAGATVWLAYMGLTTSASFFISTMAMYTLVRFFDARHKKTSD